jgi:hypothetical protein
MMRDMMGVKRKQKKMNVQWWKRCLALMKYVRCEAMPRKADARPRTSREGNIADSAGPQARSREMI